MAYYCRLSYNNNGWFLPSGYYGKSINANNHESDYGFGFEEWLFNDREFQDENQNNCHLGYIEPLKYYNNEPNLQEDLVLYTLKHLPHGGTERFIVARIGYEDWQFINHERYLNLRVLNQNQINEMRVELMNTMPMLRPGLILNRFDQQLNCLDYENNPNPNHRLFNIQIFKKNFKPILERITNTTPCPDSHILNIQMFQLYRNFNHENCNHQ